MDWHLFCHPQNFLHRMAPPHGSPGISWSGSPRDPVWCSLKEPDLWRQPAFPGCAQGLECTFSGASFLVLPSAAPSCNLCISHLSKCFIHFSYETQCSVLIYFSAAIFSVFEPCPPDVNLLNEILCKVINENMGGNNPEQIVGYLFNVYKIESKGLWLWVL